MRQSYNRQGSHKKHKTILTMQKYTYIYINYDPISFVFYSVLNLPFQNIRSECLSAYIYFQGSFLKTVSQWGYTKSREKLCR